MTFENMWSWDCEPIKQIDAADCLTKPWPSNFKGVSLSEALSSITQAKLQRMQAAVLESQVCEQYSRETKLN